MSNQPHPHAALMIQYARDWAETDRPWDRWEWRRAGYSGRYSPLPGHPVWAPDNEYRRKPDAIQVVAHGRTHKLPRPMHVRPDMGAMYYSIDGVCDGGTVGYQWADDEFDGNAFDIGLIWATEDEARAALAALKAILHP